MTMVQVEAETARPTEAAQRSGTVSQTLALLRFLSIMPYPMGVNAIARELGMAPSSCFKILKQLSEENFAEFDPVTKLYSIGGGAVLLARGALDPANIFALIRPLFETYSQRFSAAIGFWRRIANGRIILAGYVENQGPMRIHMSVGQRLPLFIGAVGRAFAYEMRLGDAELEREFRQLRWQSPIDFATYRAQVADYGVKGYAVDQDNFAQGVSTVATVLSDAQGVPTYGVSAIRLLGRTSREDIEAMGRELTALKKEIARGWLNRHGAN